MDTHRQGLEEGKLCWVEHKTFGLSYNYGELRTEMTEYIENTYNNPDVEVVNMNTFHERTQFSENGVYHVIFVLRKPQSKSRIRFQNDAQPIKYKWNRESGWQQAGKMERKAVQEWLENS